MQHDTIVILDYGSQYSQLIARRVREANVYSELLPWNAAAERVFACQPKGFILSGSPNSVYGHDAPTLPDYVIDSGFANFRHLLWDAVIGLSPWGCCCSQSKARVRASGNTD